jgi:hypothetical protein
LSFIVDARGEMHHVPAPAPVLSVTEKSPLMGGNPMLHQRKPSYPESPLNRWLIDLREKDVI